MDKGLARLDPVDAPTCVCYTAGMRAQAKRLRALLVMGVAVVALILLAAGLPGLEFQLGQSFSEEGKEQGEAPPQGGNAVTTDLTPALLVLWLALLAAFGAMIVWLIVSSEERMRALRRLLPLLLLLAALLLSRRQPQAEPQIYPEQTAAAGIAVTPAPWGPMVELDARPPRWLVWGTSIGIGLTVALCVGVLVGLLWPRDRRPPSALQELAKQAQSAVGALQAGADLKDTILRCYFEMGRAVSLERGIERRTALTPREFEQQLVGAGLPRPAVLRLTRLFEQVRYGARASSEAEEQEAIACLASIAEACRADGR